MRTAALYLLILTLLLLMQSCVNDGSGEINGGLYLPDDFEAVVVVDSLRERARHIAVNGRGDVFVNLRFSKDGNLVARLTDEDGDGTADAIEKYGKDTNEDFGQSGSYSTEMRIYRGYLYFSSELTIYRYKLDEAFRPQGKAEVILVDDHEHGKHQHIGKPLAFDNKGNMYVPFGAPSNACQELRRTPFSKGQDPCPELEEHGGIWRFDANKLNQTQKDGYEFATGIRSVVAMDWNPEDESLYAVMHGRDDLLRLFPETFSAWESALLPAEEFIKIEEGSDFGWPYCYYDQIQEKKVLAPEYGGDGDLFERCEDFIDPLIGFPGHWAPNDLVFYRGDQFPARYQNGAFIAFHGSTNRAPYPQSGYFVAFVPFQDGRPTGAWEVFADGFAGVDPIVNVNDAIYRPMGISVGPEGSLYISETEKGKIWKISFEGDKGAFNASKLAKMEARKGLSHIRTPDIINDNLMKDNLSEGERIYYTYCSACHQNDGDGARGRFPSLVRTKWVLGDKTRLINIVLNGLEGTIEVKGELYSGLMPQHGFLSDQEIAEVLTYIRSNFGNDASSVNQAEVERIRKENIPNSR